MTTKDFKKDKQKQIVITDNRAGQRIDNFLLHYFGTVPKSRVYQMIRKGEVRVNKGRIRQTYRLSEGDIVRIPPVYIKADTTPLPGQHLQKKIMDSIILEDRDFLILNKPAGIAVHGGRNQPYGVIEIIRACGKQYQDLELVHRLDKATSGCLLLARSIPVLRRLNRAIKNGEIKKNYLALVAGRTATGQWTVNNKLRKNIQRSGERLVEIDTSGKAAVSNFYSVGVFRKTSLVRVELITGRTHQIRVHSASIGHPIIGDTKYGAKDINREYRKSGLKRLFLHASTLDFISPVNGKKVFVDAPLTPDLKAFLDKIANE